MIKKLILILLLLPVLAIAQPIKKQTVKVMVVTDSLYLNDTWFKSTNLLIPSLDSTRLGFLDKANTWTGTNTFSTLIADLIIANRVDSTSSIRLYDTSGSLYALFSADTSWIPNLTVGNLTVDTVTASLRDKIRGYKVYTALLTQTDTLPPVATVLENTIGDIVWSYEGIGRYTANVPNTPYLKMYIPNRWGTPNKTNYIIFNIEDDNLISCYTYNVADYIDNVLFNTPIEIRVYN